MLRGKRIAVIGGAGFIGSHIAETLASANDVVVVDNLSSGSLKNIAGVREKVQFVKADITDQKALKAAINGTEIVFHLAAQTSVARSMVEPEFTDRVNTGGTLNVLATASDCGAKRVIFSSSAAVYGDDPRLPKREDMVPVAISPYGASKIAGELYCQVFAKSYGLYTVALRYFNIYGPRQDPASEYAAVVPKFIQAARAGRPITIFGDGEQTRDFCYVGDVVRANILAAESTGASGAILNIAGGKTITINRLAKEIIRITGSKVRLMHKPARKGDIVHSRADVRAAKEKIGFSAKVRLGGGLGEITVAPPRN